MKRVLVIADTNAELAAPIAQAAPGASIRYAASMFDGIAELAQERYSAVLAGTEPISRRPEAAIRTLRDMAPDSRLVLFGAPSLEPVSRKMLEFGCDDYLITPVNAAQLRAALAEKPKATAEPLRLHSDYDGQTREPRQEPPAPKTAAPYGQLVLESLLDHPGEALSHALAQINAQLAGRFQLALSTGGPDAITFPFPAANGQPSALVVHSARGDEPAARVFLAEIGPMLAKAAAIQHRHLRLQRTAFRDDLTGLYNSRYFHYHLKRTLAEARRARFPATLFLFDIDNFKSYNDRFGHGVGDDILRQTAQLMRRCVRDHDVVARLGGDEFAVLFSEKEGPRVAREANVGASGRPPSEPEQILARFRRLLESEMYPLLGSTGRGKLTISGGLAVYPYDAPDAKTLVEAADKALMFGAKRSGRNSIALVGGDHPIE